MCVCVCVCVCVRFLRNVLSLNNMVDLSHTSDICMSLSCREIRTEILFFF